ncbi:MAG: hypothetical protein E6R04_11300 [Spirochaetes bacterium]|nr:MAG: hypothetical protein E6R04_11300 [Spirochaetota bacterium]
MGSWQATCNISQLPITPGTPVRVLFLARCPYSMDPSNELRIGEGNNSREGCYSTDFWYPRTAPLKAIYADYGQVEKVETGLALDMFWEQLSKDMLEVPRGENPYHDPAATKDMTWDEMWDVTTKGRLRVNGSYGEFEYPSEGTDQEKWRNRKPAKPRALPVCAVMVREDVWQAMLNLRNPWELFVLGEGFKKGNVQEFANQIMKAFGPSEFHDKELARNMALRECGVDRIAPPFTLGPEFYVGQAMDRVSEGKLKLDSPELTELVTKLAELAHVCLLYSVLRKTWHPGTGCGSQSTEYETTAQFHEAMANIGYDLFEKDQEERAEWDEDHVPRKAERLRG